MKLHDWMDDQVRMVFLPWEQASCFLLWLWLLGVLEKLGFESEVRRDDDGL